MELSDIQKVLESTNMGKEEADQQIAELKDTQIGKNVTAVTAKAVANWSTHTHT
jgi:hypothetical protein